jgi:hypothetical protein
MSRIYQQVDLSESEIKRELEGLSAVIDEFDYEESQSWIR